MSALEFQNFFSTYFIGTKISDEGIDKLKMFADNSCFNTKLRMDSEYIMGRFDNRTILSRAYVNRDNRLMDFILNDTKYEFKSHDFMCIMEYIDRILLQINETGLNEEEIKTVINVVRGISKNKKLDVYLAIQILMLWKKIPDDETMFMLMDFIEQSVGKMTSIDSCMFKLIGAYGMSDDVRMMMLSRLIKFIPNDEPKFIKFMFNFLGEHHTNQLGIMSPKNAIEFIKLLVKNYNGYIPVSYLEMCELEFIMKENSDSSQKLVSLELFHELKQICIYKLLTYAVMVSHGKIIVNSSDTESSRFMRMMLNLPLEIQHTICCAVYGLKCSSYSSHKFEEVLYL